MKRRSIPVLLGQIDFSPENVMVAAAVNSVLFVEAVDHRKDSINARAEAELAMNLARAECELAVRQDARKNDEKLNEGHIKALVITDNHVQAATRAFNHAEQVDEYMKLVVEAFRMRRDCLQIVKDLVRNEMSSQSAYEAGAEKMAAARKKLRERFPEVKVKE